MTERTRYSNTLLLRFYVVLEMYQQRSDMSGKRAIVAGSVRMDASI
jgi:hypothetical protein